MYSLLQESRLDKIREENAKHGTILQFAMLEECGELMSAYSSYVQCKSDDQVSERKHVLEECVDAMNTIHNYMTHFYTYEEINDMIDLKIAKAEKLLNIN